MPHSSAPLDYVSSAYVICDNRVLLVFHKTLHLWLPPGGHIEAGETPSACAVREVLEETGLHIDLLATPSTGGFPETDRVTYLIQPVVIQLEVINREHQHVDFVYVGTSDTLETTINRKELHDAHWFNRIELEEYTISDNVRHVAHIALQLVRNQES